LKTIGILGGMSWESSAVYYRRLNELIQEQCGGVASAKVILHSFNFQEIDRLQHEDRWDELAGVLTRAASGLKAAGADFLVIATNTMHLLADRIESDAGIPLLHIADGVARRITDAGYQKVALLGTRFTMERSFYADRLKAKSGVESLIPDEAEREAIHKIIYTELCAGELRDESRARIVDVINRLSGAGAQAAVLGCTELPLLVHDGDAVIPVLDTGEFHVQAAVRMALE
jgi:amino-acid racemase